MPGKILILAISGDEKTDLAIRFAHNVYTNKRFDDVRIAFFGPAQKRILSLDQETRVMLDKLVREGVVDSACVFVAQSQGIEKDLREGLGIRLEPIGARISYYVERGYEVLTF